MAVLQASNLQVAFEVLLVWNHTNRRVPGAPTRYSAQLSSTQASKKIRDAFSGFFRRTNPLARPPVLTNVSIRNKVSLATRVRTAVMRQLGVLYKARNPGATFNVRGFEPRPLLSITPPAGAADSRQRTLNFIEAATTLPASLSDDHLMPIFRVIGNNFRGELQALFIILRDDDHDRLITLLRQQDRQQQPRPHPSGRPQPQAIVGPAATYAGVVAQAGDGAELQAGVVWSLLLPPPPPPVESPSVHGSPRAHGRSTRSSGQPSKRRRSPSRPPSSSGHTSKRRRSPGSRSTTSRRSRKSRKRSPSSSTSSSSSGSSSSSSSSSSNED